MDRNNTQHDHPSIGKPTLLGVKPSWETFSILAAIAIGAGLRLYFYLSNRSLWFDEALLALNLTERSFAELMQPLDYNQSAPLGFLLIQKTVISLLGNRDYLLRLIPLLAGLTSLPLFFLTARLFLRPVAVHAAMWLFALSPHLIYYSSECKQYSSDVFIALLLIWVAAPYLQDRRNDRRLLLIGSLGTLALWFSHPALFVLAGIFFAIGVDRLVHRDWTGLGKLLATGCLAALSLYLNYLASLQFQDANQSLHTYWQASFAPLPPWQDWGWYAQAWKNILHDPLKLPVNAFSTAVLLVGLYSLAARRWQTLLVLSAPAFLTLAASALQLYPFSERMLLFLVPSFLFILADGIDFIRLQARKQRIRLGQALLLTLLAIFLYVYSAENIKRLPASAQIEHIKPLLVHIREHARPQELIYVYYGSKPTFLYYAPQMEFDEQSYLLGSYSRDNPEGYLQEIEAFAAGRRVWILITHNCSWCAVDEQAFILAYLDQIGQQKDALVLTNASLYLYDLR